MSWYLLYYYQDLPEKEGQLWVETVINKANAISKYKTIKTFWCLKCNTEGFITLLQHGMM